MAERLQQLISDEQPQRSVRVLRADTAGWSAAPLAELTRLAYAGSDPLPGLPTPDGAFETAEAVRAELAAGGEVYAIWPALAGPVAALRVRRSDARWTISRIAVLPGWRGAGLVRLLLAAVAERAAGAGAAELELAAVVERCLPGLYAGLGFQVSDNWPSPDKPLSEVTMRRPCAGPVIARRFGWQRAAFRRHSGVICWFLTGGRLVRVAVPASKAPLADAVRAATLLGEPDALLAGVDLSCRSGRRNLIRPVADGRRHPEHLVPRVRRPSTLAIWRPAPGQELPVAELAVSQ